MGSQRQSKVGAAEEEVVESDVEEVGMNS